MTDEIANQSSPLLEVDDLGIRAEGRWWFKGIAWRIRPGERWAVLGGNGSGKSLLAAALCGEVPFARAELRFGSEAARNVAPRVVAVGPREHRALIRGQSTFYQSRWHSGLEEGGLTVRQHLSWESVEAVNPFEVVSTRKADASFKARQRGIIGQLLLRPLLDRLVAQLSTGEGRKLVLAHALLQRPDFLILDDPCAGLDEATRRWVTAWLGRLGDSVPPFLLLTPRPDELPESTTHVMVLGDGRVTALGPRQEVLCKLGGRAGHVMPGASPPASASKQSTGRRSTSARPMRDRPAQPMVELDRVTVRQHRKTILREVNWTVRQGERWLLLGPNGAGKTTLLGLIQGDHPQIYAQAVRLFGRALGSTSGLWTARQKMGWMSPELALHYPPEWSARAVVLSGCFQSVGLHQIPTRRQQRAAAVWVEKLGLLHQAEAPLGSLCLGDQRLLFLARAVVAQPRLLILDEPCQGLDAHYRRRMLNAVDTVVAATDATLILVTHHAAERPACITHYLRLAAGRVVEQGRFEQRSVP
jgi:molybdate transport system ATP-binding protein